MKNKKGFTLIELLVAVIIIGILAAIALPQYKFAIEKSRATEALISSKNLSDAENRYFLITGKYTTNIEELDVQVSPRYFDVSLSWIIEFNYVGISLPRKNYQPNYWFSTFNVDGRTLQISCAARDEFGMKICRSYNGDCTTDGITLICQNLKF